MEQTNAKGSMNQQKNVYVCECVCESEWMEAKIERKRINKNDEKFVLKLVQRARFSASVYTSSTEHRSRNVENSLGLIIVFQLCYELCGNNS